MTQVQIGDILQIKDPRLVYTTYDRMFQRMGFLNKIENEEFEEGTIVKVFYIDYHPDFGHELCAVRDMNGREALYDVKGLQEIAFKRPEPKSLKVQLGDYTADVYKDCIKVGCQTIYYSEFKSLMIAAKTIGFIN
jgi:hypothetical protein